MKQGWIKPLAAPTIAAASLMMVLAGMAAPVTAQAASATVYYYTPYKNWSSNYIHHNASGTWTTAPGVLMDAACTNWKVKTLSFTTTNFAAVFTNGAGAWDNPGNVSGTNYTVSAGTHQVKNGSLIANAGNPCDSVAPSVPGNLQSTSVGSSSIGFSWTASTDNVGVTGYNVYRSGVLAGTSTSASFSDAGLSASTAYSYTVSAKDGAGNQSAQSAPLAVSTVAAPASVKPGVTYSAVKSSFAIWSPDSANVQLKLAGVLYPMNKAVDANGYSSVYAVDVPGNHHLKHYNFVINGKNVRDPYGVMVDAGTTSATPDNIVLDLSQTALSGGWAARPALVQRADAVIYEVHVRDFTIDASSGVDAAKRGKFAGMTQTGTTLNGAGLVKTGIDHLKELGVTHVQLMPIYDFGTCSPLMVQDPTNPVPDPNPWPSSLCYNWGYDPVNFNVPEERYSMNQADPVARVRELKALVNEFHKNGIRVIMDVVYNHTYNKAVFADITGKYYTATDLSGTGNSIDVKNPMVARMIRDSLAFWAGEYNLDGFRFDLMGIYDTAVVADWARYLDLQYPGRNFLIYGEPWNGGVADPAEADRVRLGSVGTIVDAHVGVFNSKYREALKGDSDSGLNLGFIFNAGDYWGTGQWASNGAALGPISSGMYGSPRYANAGGALANVWDPMFALAPEQSINYVDAHDNLCLNDKVEAWAAANAQAGNTGYKDRIQQFAIGSVLTAQGMTFLHGGSEFKRTKGGEQNSYRSPDTVNKYNWNWKSANPGMLAMAKKLIALRRAHPAFRFTSWQGVRDNVKSDQQSKSLIVTNINGAAAGDSWGKIMVIQNAGGNTTVSLPLGNWKVALEQSNPNLAERIVSGSVVAEGTAVTILYQ
jgi:pullulanase